MRRPRLRDDVSARRYIDGETSRVILASETGTFALTPRSWIVGLAMDGTRDAEGLRRHAKTEGVSVELAEVESLIAELARAHLVEDDDSEPVAAPSEGSEPVDDLARRSKPIHVVDSFRLTCDGGGICCRLYPTILFSPEEAARARATLPQILDGGYDEARVFTPDRGGRSVGRAVAVVDGRCAYLAANGACGIHAKAGADAKPIGCRAYPARYVDEGARLVVSPSLECPCVFRSRGATTGDAIVEPGPLDPALVIDEVPNTVSIGDDLSFSRAEYLAWARARGDAPLGPDVSRTLMRWSLELTGQPTNEADITSRTLTSITRFHERLTSARANSHRSARDFVTTLFEALDVACALITRDDLAVSDLPISAEDESFYARMLLAGHQLIAPARAPLGPALAERAARVAIARALHAVREIAELDDPVFQRPLALVEAASRLLPTRTDETRATI